MLYFIKACKKDKQIGFIILEEISKIIPKNFLLATAKFQITGDVLEINLLILKSPTE